MTKEFELQSEILQPVLIDLRTYYFNGSEPQVPLTEVPARIQSIALNNGDLEFQFIHTTGRNRQYSYANMPGKNLDALLDTYLAHSTHQLCDQKCTLFKLEKNVLGMRMPTNNDRRRRAKCIEILTEYYDDNKATQQIPATLGEIKDDDKYDSQTLTRNRTLTINWTSRLETYTGPTSPIELTRESRMLWTKMFSRPIYHSRFFSEPTNILVQNGTIVGIQYGELITKQEAKATDAQNNPNAHNLKGQNILWNGREIEVPKYYEKELTKILHDKPHSRLTELLKIAQEKKVIVEGVRELIIFDDSSRLRSMTIYCGKVHEITLNARIDSQIWEEENSFLKTQMNDALFEHKTKAASRKKKK